MCIKLCTRHLEFFHLTAQWSHNRLEFEYLSQCKHHTASMKSQACFKMVLKIQLDQFNYLRTVIQTITEMMRALVTFLLHASER